MNGDIGKRIQDCPLGFDVCYPSCFWWRRNYVCSFQVERQTRKELADMKAMRAMSRYGHKPRPTQRNPDDPTEEYRKGLIGGMRSQQESDDPVTERKRLKAKYGQVWNTEELTRDFDVIAFMAPFVSVIEEATGRKGTLMFQDYPRFYFNFRPIPRERNPVYKQIDYGGPRLVKPKKAKVDPEEYLPWRMFVQYGPQLCRKCGTRRPAIFVVAKSRASADKVFAKGNGLCPTCMCQVLLAPRERIAVLDGGVPNPFLAFVAPKARPVVIVSPYRLFGFSAKKPRRCGCGNDRWQFYVIARNLEEAQKRVDRYGQCALCMCELLCLDRYAVQTTDGGLP